MRVNLKTLCLALSAVALAQRAPAQLITEFPMPAGSHPTAIAPGPGGMWFAELESRVGVITPEGRVTEFPVSARAIALVAGPDGNVWFTSSGHLSRITPGGVVTEFPAPGGSSLTVGPDGNLWFPASTGRNGRNLLCRATTDGQITEIDLGSYGGSRIAVGADGNFWLTEWNAIFGGILRVTPSGVVTAFDLAGLLGDLTPGPDGNVWGTVYSGHLLRISPSGDYEAFFAPVAGAIASGRDGNLWFTGRDGRIGRMTPQGALAMFYVPTAGAQPYEIAPAPDGSLWFTEGEAGQIGRVATASGIQELALGDGRFRVALGWSSGTGSGPGHPVMLSSSAGYFWFHHPDNPEVFVKLLDWCPDDALFFAAGLTSFGTTLTLSDTRTGVSRAWVTAPDSAFQPIQEHVGACSGRSIAGSWTGTFESLDFVGCDLGAARADLQQSGSSVSGTLSADGGCGWDNVRFQGSLSGTTLTGKVSGGPFREPFPASGTVWDGKLVLRIDSINGSYYYAAGALWLHR